MSSVPEVVIAGGGISAAATAIRLRQLGFDARLLVRTGAEVLGIEALPERALGLLDVLGEPGLLADAGGVLVTAGDGSSPLVHVERRALARVFLDRAQSRGAVVSEVRRLPPAATVESTAAAVVDATGRAAAWSRPLATDGHEVAWQFEGPPQVDVALRVERGERWWGYRLGTAGSTWAGVVVGAGGAGLAGEGLRRLGLDPAAMTARGRRPARVQRSVHPVAGRRISVGDAALAHDPIAGAGIRFALSSAVAASTAIATWVEDPACHDLAAEYYGGLVVGEHARHLQARRAIHAGDREVSLVEAEPGLETGLVPDAVRFTAPVVEAALAVDGMVRPGAAVRLPDGTLTRWLGSFDLLVLARLATDPVPRVVLLAHLQEEGLDIGAARAVLSWAFRHRLLIGCQGADSGAPLPGSHSGGRSL